MFKCHLVIEGSLTDIQEIMGLLSGVKENVKHVGPVPKEITQDQLEPFSYGANDPVEAKGNTACKDQAEIQAPIDARIEYTHCMTCGKQFVKTKKQTTDFCSPKCYAQDWYDRSKAKKAVKPQEPASDIIKSEDPKGKQTSEKKFKSIKKPVISDNFGGLY